MKFIKFLLYSSFFILHSSLCSAQEQLAPLRTNPTLVNLTRLQKKLHTPVWRQTQDSIVDILPFLDDFSKPGPYPDTSKWMDNAAFINFTYPVCPHTLGVATLDGVNGEGMPYNPKATPNSSYPADSLTSRPIDLTWNYLTKAHNLYSGDSIYFSFYYQPGGLGQAPKYSDTLLLQFKTSQIPWTTIWYQTGYTPSTNDTDFHYVLLPINDTTHYSGVLFNPFDPNFQFRFKNYACTSANVDQWNIDEVYLDLHRYATDDTSQLDVSFVYEAPSLLANYQYMPYEQFIQNDLADSIFMFERSNDNYSKGISMSYRDSIFPVSFGSVYLGGTYNIYPWGGLDIDCNCIEYYNNYAPQTHIHVKKQFNYSPLSSPTTITMIHMLQATNDFDLWNDTVRFEQKFSNYFAYDDGTAEAAYFINGGGNPSDLAYQFTLNKPDTLVGLEIFFSYMFGSAEGYTFRLAIWDNSGPGGSPGVLKWENDTIYSPRYSDSLNGFVYYPYYFDKDTTFSGTFYVGWIQTYGDSLDIGYDLNTNHSDKIYYYVNTYPTGDWSPGDIPGSMMMRPVFGNNRYNAIPVVKNTPELITLYPNPAQDEITLSKSMAKNTILKIYGVDGRKWIEYDNFTGTKVNTSALPAGVYILELNLPDGSTFYQKLFIQR